MMQFKKHSLSKSGISRIALIIGFCAGSVGAPGKSALAQVDQEEETTFEEIVVVARKRAENLQDVPVSATILSGENIKVRGLTEVMDVIRETPNIAFPDTTHGNINLNIVIRGVSSNTRSVGFESGVGVYVDGVYLGRPSSFNQELVDVSHIEVLRGPQGTLFGKNNLSGAINILTNQPSLGNWEVGGKLEYASFENYSENFYANVPLGDSVAVRFNVYKNDSEGYILNIFDGSHFANDDTFGARGQILFQLSEKFKLTVSGDYRKDDFNIALPEVIFDGGVPGFSPVIPGPFTTVNNVPPVEDRELGGVSATAEYEFDSGFTLTAISAYRSMDIFDHLENDNDAADLIELKTTEEERHFTQEIRLTSPGGERFDYVIGAYYLNQEAEVSKFGILFPPHNIHVLGQVDTKSWAVFGDAQYDISPELTLGVGLRYTNEKKNLLDLSQTTTAALAGFFPSFAPVNDSRSSDNLSPLVSLSYEFSDAATGYVKYSRGFKSGGWNVDLTSAPVSPVTDPEPLRFDDENMTSYEIGLKTRLFDRRLRLDMSVFSMKLKDQQVQQREGVQFLISNAASSSIKGVDADFSLIVTEDITFSGGLGYLDATYDSFTGCTSGGDDCTGNRLSDAPNWTANFALDWDHVFENIGKVSAHIDYVYRGDYFSNTPTEDPRVLTGTYNSFNANIGFGPESEKWRLTFFVKNLFDRLNPVGRFLETVGDPGTIGESYAPPRAFGVRLNVSL